MKRSWRLAVWLLCWIACCAAQSDVPVTEEAVGDPATCRNSSSDVCVRTCCPEGENIIDNSCRPSTIAWKPTFLNESDIPRMEVVPGFIPPCRFGHKLQTFSDTVDPLTHYALQPSGELTVVTSTEVFDVGYDYCFYNIEYEGFLYEGVKSCQVIEVPQLSGLVSIEDVSSVSLRKCCTESQSIGVVTKEEDGETYQDFGCVEKEESWSPSVLQGYPTSLVQIPEDKKEISDSEVFQCPKGTEEEYFLSTDLEHANFLLSNSSLFLPNFNVSFAPGHFCQDQFSSSGSPSPVTKACYETGKQHTQDDFEAACPEGDVCALKCCAPGFYLTEGRCTPTMQRWEPTFFQGRKQASGEVRHRLLHGRAACDESGDSFVFSRRLSEEDTPYLQLDGHIEVPGINLTFKRHECCIDSEKYYDSTRQAYDIADMAICCHQRDLKTEIRDIVASILLTISAIFLFIMLGFYMLVPKLRNIHGKCLMSHAAALFVAFFLTAFNQFYGVSLGPSCDMFGLLLYYSFIAALFWLNVMSFDIWWTFANLRTQQPSERSLRNRFVRHSLYAWGVPLLMTALLSFFNYAPDSVLPPGTVLRPDLGTRKCFLSDNKVQLYYFYVPIFIVTGVNIVFFVATAWTLFSADRSTQKILKRKRTARDRLKVYVNLFIIMEVSWIAECLSTQIPPPEAWYFTDIINASQGMLIFLLFIARKTTRQTIAERFRELCPCGAGSTRTAGPAAANGAKVQSGQNPSSQTKTTHASSSSTGARKSSDADAMAMGKLANGEPAGGRPSSDPKREANSGSGGFSPAKAGDDPDEGGLVNDVFENDSIGDCVPCSNA